MDATVSQANHGLAVASNGLTHSHSHFPTYPPVPSLASLPVDKTKTEPKPAYYKLQFGDDVTGFSYYVRTLAIHIGRKCDKAVPEKEEDEDVAESFVKVDLSPPLAEFPVIEEKADNGELEAQGPDVTVQDVLPQEGELGASSSDEAKVETDVIPMEEDVKQEVEDEPKPKEGDNDSAQNDELEQKPQDEGAENLDQQFDEDLPPPPPPPKSAGPTEHVDVDLGPLKSVSRNHAKISFWARLGCFCLEITGRNGAWVDDRYYVKGSTVPLTQGSQIQIATRIFSFILPPSAISSPAYSQYGFESTPQDTEHTLDDVPYPFNLPPGQVGYAEFYGEPGPGPVSAANIATRSPPPAFNAFAAADGYGLGIEGVGDNWDDDDSDSEDSWDEDDDEEEEGEEEGEEGDAERESGEQAGGEGESEQSQSASTQKKKSGKGKKGDAAEATPEKPEKPSKAKKKDKDPDDTKATPTATEKKPAKTPKEPKKKTSISVASASASATPAPEPATLAEVPMKQSPAPSTINNNSSTTLEPQTPFYCTELNETPGRPGHIIVNVPIPPSGAGPRPPPGPLIGLDGNPFIGPPPLKPAATFATIIHRALTYLPRGRGTLGEVCNWVAGEWEWFRLNVDAGWQNSIRHNLSLNKAFLKVPRIPEDDPESKGSVWIIDPHEGPAFEEKQRRDAMKVVGKDKNPDVKRERDRIKTEERARKQREMAMEQARARALAMKANAQKAAAAPQQAQNQAQAQGQTQGQSQQGQTQQPARQPVAARAHPRPQATKTGLNPKAKVTVSIQTLTPAIRAKSLINPTDAAGNPLPFACDGSVLVLDQGTFGHLTSDIIDKLTLLGAAGAVDVLSAWVINRNKNQAARAAQNAQSKLNGGNKAVPAKNGVTANVHRPANSSATSAQASQSKEGAAAGTPKVVPKKPLPGPAPPGASLTKVIGMIAEVANAKGDVNTVGPNAGALLRYIRVVGVDIDLKMAEKIWATGEVPPLPPKKATQPNGAAKPNPQQPAKTALNNAAAAPTAATPAATTTPSGVAPAAQAGVKRKAEEDAPQEVKKNKVEA